MEGFGIDKILLILVVILLLFGAKRIPEIAGSFGKGIREFKRQMGGIGDSASTPRALPPPPASSETDANAGANAEDRTPKRLI